MRQITTSRYSSILNGRDALLAAVAIVGTAAYVLSFGLLDYGRIPAVVLAVGPAAGLSWFVLGAALLLIGGRAVIVPAMRLCLRTMAIGIAILTASMVLNGLIGRHRIDGFFWVQFHYYLLIASDGAMAGYFIGRAPRLGISRLVAGLLWVFALNGAFVLLVFVFLQLTGGGVLTGFAGGRP